MHLHVLWHSAFSIFWPQSRFFHLPIRRYHNRAPPFLCQPNLFISLETNCKLLFPFWKPCPPENHWRSPFGCQKKVRGKNRPKGRNATKNRALHAHKRLQSPAECVPDRNETYPLQAKRGAAAMVLHGAALQAKELHAFSRPGQAFTLASPLPFWRPAGSKKPGTRPGLFLSPRQETGEALPKR